MKLSLQQEFEEQDEIEDFESFTTQTDESATGTVAERYLERAPNSAANGTVT